MNKVDLFRQERCQAKFLADRQLGGFDPGVDRFDGRLQRADVALYRAKLAGRNTLWVFDQSMIEQSNRRDRIDLTMRAGELDLIMEELLVSPDSRLVDKNLIDSEIRKKYDVIVVAIKRQDGSMLFNPRPDTIILAGDILIVLGASEHIAGLGREM